MSKLKKGAVICITGEAPEKWSQEDEFRFRKQLSKFDAVHFITPQLIPYVFHRIWFKMVSKGITDLIIAKVEFNASGKLYFNSNDCRLPMIGMS